MTEEVENKVVEETNFLDFEDWLKVDLRVAVVKSVEEIKKSKKLLKLELDIGDDKPRTVLSGIKKFFKNPQDLVGRQVLYLVNLAPRKMFGFESTGMVLAAVEEKTLVTEEGTKTFEHLTLLQPTLKVSPGTKVS
jgi:methionyl-tRNA synthetase